MSNNLLDRICMKIPQATNINDIISEYSWRCSPERDLILVYHYHINRDSGSVEMDGCSLYKLDMDNLRLIKVASCPDDWYRD
mgnify:CR=1 FL=1